MTDAGFRSQTEGAFGLTFFRVSSPKSSPNRAQATDSYHIGLSVCKVLCSKNDERSKTITKVLC